MKPVPTLVDFKDSKFVFGNGHIFPSDHDNLTPAQIQDIHITGQYVAAMFEFNSRFVPGFVEMLDHLDNPEIASHLHDIVNQWKEEARALYGGQ